MCSKCVQVQLQVVQGTKENLVESVVLISLPRLAKRKPPLNKGVPRKGPGARNSKMNSVRDSHDSVVTHRMMSARRLKVNDLRNKVEELSQQLYEVERENKLLKRQNVMKDRVIDKHEGEEGEVSLPSFQNSANLILKLLNFSLCSRFSRKF